jgi:hypothetical protein
MPTVEPQSFLPRVPVFVALLLVIRAVKWLQLIHRDVVVVGTGARLLLIEEVDEDCIQR